MVEITDLQQNGGLGKGGEGWGTTKIGGGEVGLRGRQRGRGEVGLSETGTHAVLERGI
jgi:hypothetical protein